MYAELERLIGLFRAGSPNIAKAFDEVERLLKQKDARIAELEQDIDELDARLVAAAAALAPPS